MAAFGIVPHPTPRRSSQSLDAKRGGREDGQAGDAVALTGQRGQGAGPAGWSAGFLGLQRGEPRAPRW